MHASKNPSWRCSDRCLPHHVVACYPAVVGLRGKHHIELGLVRPSLSLVPGIEGQAQGVFIAQVNLCSVPGRGEPQHHHCAEHLIAVTNPLFKGRSQPFLKNIFNVKVYNLLHRGHQTFYLAQFCSNCSPILKQLFVYFLCDYNITKYRKNRDNPLDAEVVVKSRFCFKPFILSAIFVGVWGWMFMLYPVNTTTRSLQSQISNPPQRGFKLNTDVIGRLQNQSNESNH